MDEALAALYDAGTEGPRSDGGRYGASGSSAPSVARWLGDIRSYFPTSVVQVMQRDAIDRLGLTRMLLEPELLDSVQPDVHLAATLVSLNRVMPETTKRTARLVVGRVVAEIERRIAQQTRAAVTGAVNRSSRTQRPRWRDVDWNATIRRNLDHYLPEYRTMVPEVWWATVTGRRRCWPGCDRGGGPVGLDGRVGGLCGGLRGDAGLDPSVRTSLVAFDTDVVDLTDRLSDPVEVLFGCQLGGGTDINRASRTARAWSAGRPRRSWC